MRVAALAVISVLAALAACNPSAPQGESQTSADAGGSGGGAFPNLTQATYRAEATITSQSGRTMPIVMIRDGHKMRMEMSTPQGQSTIISNADTGESFVITTAAGRTMAMRATASNQVSNPADVWAGDFAATATRTGDCSGAGQSGTEWSRTDDNGVVKTTCVTSDGIILRAAEGDRTTWETTSVERGPQSADLFVLPEGVQVVDLNNIPGVAEALERAKASQGGQ